MSLTQTNHIFAGVGQGGLNTLLQATFNARPHYLNYGSPVFVPVSTAGATSIPTIPFPGVPGGIQYAISFSNPQIDLFPPDAGTLSPIPPGPNQFGVHTTVRITIGCFTWNPQTDPNGREGGKMVPLTTKLDVWATGHLISRFFGAPGSGDISLSVDDIRIPEIKPNSLEQVIECLIRMMLRAALESVHLPITAFSAGAFKLILQRGPEISDDQVKIWGDIV